MIRCWPHSCCKPSVPLGMEVVSVFHGALGLNQKIHLWVETKLPPAVLIEDGFLWVFIFGGNKEQLVFHIPEDFY